MEQMNFEINNHSDRLNGQVLLSFILSCYNVPHSYCQTSSRYVAGNLQTAWNEWRVSSPSAFISPPRVRKCQIKQLNSPYRWPTVLLLSTLRITRPQRICQSMVNSWQRSLWLQQRMFTTGSLHSISYRRDFCATRGVTSLQIDPSRFFQ